MKKARKYFEKDVSGCALSGILNEDGTPMSGEEIVRSITVMNERGNGLGAGFAGYGIYPDYADYYAFHLLYSDVKAKDSVEKFLEENFHVEVSERIPTRSVDSIRSPPALWRYFVKPRGTLGKLDDDELVVQAVMYVNSCIDGAFVMSSGKNMGVFKAVGNLLWASHMYPSYSSTR